MKPETTIEKLRVLLPHWLEHNRHHAAEFRQWASSARNEDAGRLAELLERAAAGTAAVDEILKEAESEAGGPDDAHRVPHGHDDGAEPASPSHPHAR